MKSYVLVSAGAVVAASWAVAAPPAFHDAVLGDAPVLWYQFNEPDGSDETVNYGSLGEEFNGVYHDVGLEAGTLQGDDGACFDSANKPYVESKAGAPQNLLGNPSFTAEAVVRVFDITQNSNYGPFLNWGDAASGKAVFFSMWHQSKDRAFAGYHNGGMRMAESFAAGEWVHLVWVRDAGGGQNNCLTGSTFYVDGQETPLEKDTDLCCVFVPIVTSTTFKVQRAKDFARVFSGDIDEVALYDRVLSADEVQEHFEALVEGACYPDRNGDGVLDLFDFLKYVNEFNAGDAAADCNPNDHTCAPKLDLFDFLCFVNKFNAGCP